MKSYKYRNDIRDRKGKLRTWLGYLRTIAYNENSKVNDIDPEYGYNGKIKNKQKEFYREIKKCGK